MENESQYNHQTGNFLTYLPLPNHTISRTCLVVVVVVIEGGSQARSKIFEWGEGKEKRGCDLGWGAWRVRAKQAKSACPGLEEAGGGDKRKKAADPPNQREGWRKRLWRSGVERRGGGSCYEWRGGRQRRRTGWVLNRCCSLVFMESGSSAFPQGEAEAEEEEGERRAWEPVLGGGDNVPRREKEERLQAGAGSQWG